MLSVLFLAFSYYHRHEIFSEVKKVTEQKISSLLRANVSIDNIKIGVLNEISLSHFQIDERKKNSFFSLINVNKIVLKLNPLSYLLQPFRIPNTIVMDAPDLKLQMPTEKGSVFNWEPFFLWENLALVINNGRAEYDLVLFNNDLLIENIDGKIRSLGEKRYDFGFFADVRSFFSGSVAISGNVQREPNDFNLHVVFEDMQFDENLWIPVRSMNGDIRVTKDAIHIDRLVIWLRGMPVEVQGTITSYLQEPRFDLSFSVLNNIIRVQGGYPERVLTINANIFGGSYTINGEFEVDDAGITFSNMVTDIGYEVTAGISWEKRASDLFIFHKEKEIKIDFQYHDGRSQVLLDLNHMRLFGYDSVFKGRLELSLLSTKTSATPLRMGITTDYFIFNYIPLKEFRGECFVGAEGLEKIDVSWGTVYNLKGNIRFDELNQADLLFSINNFDISSISDFYGEKVRMGLKGRLNGTVDLQGPANNPDIIGALTIDNGAFNSMEFEETILNFTGNKFLLRFHDSIIKSKSRTFYIKGDFDFTLNNPLNGIVVQTSERVIVWRGFDIATDAEEDGIAFSKRMTDKLTLSAKTLKANAEKDAQPFSQSVSLDYDFGDLQTLSLEATEGDDEELVQLRHKFRF